MLVLWLLAMLAAPENAPAVENAVIVQPVSNMYSKPSTDADVGSQAIYSTNITILEKQPGWLKVRTPDGYTGWIQANAAVPAPAYAVSGRVAEVDSLFAGLYRETDITTHQPLAIVPFETRLEVTAGPVGEEDRWFQVRLPDGRPAWVQSGDVTFSQQKLSIPELISWSKRFLGLPYIWGGTSTLGYDCSGFTQMLCRRRGYSLPRDSTPQSNWSGMRAVDRADLQPGDLLYFGDPPKKITHTGMYIGNGEFINATAYQKPRVQISRIDDEHWTKTKQLLAIRRIQ